MINMTDLHKESWPQRYTGLDDSPLCAAKKTAPARRLTLLEHWPERKSFMVHEEDEDAPDSLNRDHRHKQTRAVQFSETSQLYVYERESMTLLRGLCCSKEERNGFGRAALLEGFRIKMLAEEAPADSTADSIRYLLRHDIISRDELIGIEHFVLCHPSRVQKIRKRHAAAVLCKQQEQQNQNLEDPVLSLGKFAQSSSLKATKRARVRAAMAA